MFYENEVYKGHSTDDWTQIDLDILNNLYNEVKSNNPFYNEVKLIKDTYKGENNENYKIIFSDEPPFNSAKRIYNKPTVAEVGGIIIGNPAVDGAREISFRRYNDTIRSIKSNHSIYDALSYGITHTKGDKGWFIGLHKHVFDENNQIWVENSKHLTVLDYYSYRSHQ